MSAAVVTSPVASGFRPPGEPSRIGALPVETVFCGDHGLHAAGWQVRTLDCPADRTAQAFGVRIFLGRHELARCMPASCPRMPSSACTCSPGTGRMASWQMASADFSAWPSRAVPAGVRIAKPPGHRAGRPGARRGRFFPAASTCGSRRTRSCPCARPGRCAAGVGRPRGQGCTAHHEVTETQAVHARQLVVEPAGEHGTGAGQADAEIQRRIGVCAPVAVRVGVRVAVCVAVCIAAAAFGFGRWRVSHGRPPSGLRAMRQVPRRSAARTRPLRRRTWAASLPRPCPGAPAGRRLTGRVSSRSRCAHPAAEAGPVRTRTSGPVRR